MTDDILGVFGDTARTGKSALTDLREGKQTALIAYAGATKDWPAIAPFVGKVDLTEEEAEEARRLLHGCGARRSADDLAIDHARRAIAALVTPAIPDALRETLTQLADTSINRSR